MLETLERLIPTFPKLPKPTRKYERIGANLTNVTPLSISRGPKPISKSARFTGTAFEDRVKQQNFDSSTKVDFVFDAENRRIKQTALEVLPSAEFGEARHLTDADSPSHRDLTITKNQESKHAKGEVAVNASAIAKLDANQASEAAIEGLMPSSASWMPCPVPSSEDNKGSASTIALSTRHPSKSLCDSGKPRLAASLPRLLDSSPSTEPSAETSEETASPSSLVDGSSNTHGSSSPSVIGVLNATSTFSNAPSRSIKVSNKDYRQDFSSDADDERDLDESDLETHADEDDHDVGDDVLPSQDKDDDGLHEHLREITIKGKGKRHYDGEGSFEEGEGGGWRTSQ